MSATVTHIRRLPMSRAECADGPRPCPHATCRHHLGVEVSETCSLDVAERGGIGVREAGKLLGISHARVEQIERDTFAKIAHSHAMTGFDERGVDARRERQSGVQLRVHIEARAATLAEETDDEEFAHVEVVDDPWAAAAWRALQRMGRR